MGFTAKLVPLGGKFEKANSITCNGYGQKTLQDLIGDEAGRALDGNERDVPLCKPSAGAPPCELLDFSDVTTARQFHVKMEKLYWQFLKHHCNREWGVHFEALLVRMRHSLFCDDGSQSDHPGYTISTAPPPVTDMTLYKPVKKPEPETPKPPAPQVPQPPPNSWFPDTPTPNNPNPPVHNPYAYPGPAPSTGYCPWNPGNCGKNGCPADCPNTLPAMCSLKFVGRCYNNLFNKVYKDICRWQEALQLMPHINTQLVALGVKWEVVTGKKCNANLKTFDRELEQDPSMDYDFSDMFFNHRRRRAPGDRGGDGTERDVAVCKTRAGLVPCSMMDGLDDVKDEADFFFKIEALVNHVGKDCNEEWRRHMGAYIRRLKNALICPGGITPDGR